MSTIQALLTCVDRYSAATGIATATLSSRIFNHGARLEQVRNGADIGGRRIDFALQWFSDRWPSNIEWPSEIARPEPVKSEVAA
ncbi:hypothetical protein AB4037_23145 [Labrys sp. KB_33_2]|uniref:hypothetical protein n=1 Tax=Labrys sp. KB_33_2 TaxID=3237479 RepID=UPI003F8F2E14